MEVYVLVPVRKSFFTVFLGSVCLAFAIIFLLLGCSSPLLVYIALLLAAACYLLVFRFGTEYECSYFDGEVRFAKIFNKSRRKSLGTCSMEDVVVIAPAGDPGVARYESDARVKVKDYTSRIKERPYYELVMQKDGEILLYKLELDEPYLAAVEKQYKQKVIRR